MAGGPFGRTIVEYLRGGGASNADSLIAKCSDAFFFKIMSKENGSRTKTISEPKEIGWKNVGSKGSSSSSYLCTKHALYKGGPAGLLHSESDSDRGSRKTVWHPRHWIAYSRVLGYNFAMVRMDNGRGGAGRWLRRIGII